MMTVIARVDPERAVDAADHTADAESYGTTHRSADRSRHAVAGPRPAMGSSFSTTDNALRPGGIRNGQYRQHGHRDDGVNGQRQTSGDSAHSGIPHLQLHCWVIGFGAKAEMNVTPRREVPQIRHAETAPQPDR